MSSISGSTSSRPVRSLAASLAVIAVAACATVPRLVPPSVRAAEVKVIVFDFPLVRLGVDLVLDNPNAVDIALSSVDAALDVEGTPIARASLAQPVTLAARRETKVHIDATGNLSTALSGVARSLARGRGPIRYELAGSAELADGRRLPFRKAGVLAL